MKPIELLKVFPLVIFIMALRNDCSQRKWIENFKFMYRSDCIFYLQQQKTMSIVQKYSDHDCPWLQYEHIKLTEDGTINLMRCDSPTTTTARFSHAHSIFSWNGFLNKITNKSINQLSIYLCTDRSVVFVRIESSNIANSWNEFEYSKRSPDRPSDANQFVMQKYRLQMTLF